MFSKTYLRLNQFTLVFIFLVVIAGSFVRISGSGMGCPDWPRCFGQVIPPTSEADLPKDYKEIYAAKREKKILKFASFLEKIGFAKEAQELRTNKSLLIEDEFNARKTWTEYINRLFGVLAGFGVLFIFVGALRKYRKRKIVLLSTVNLIVLVIQAWFGSIVVATKLVPWTITVHLFLALLIILLQIQLIYEIQKNRKDQKVMQRFELSSAMKWIIWSAFIITFIQMFLGTQVREYIDNLTAQGFGRETWTEKLGISFLIHRSFSWLVLITLTILAFLNYKNKQYRFIYTSFVVLVLELISGVLLAYTDMPGLVQTSHLVFACVLFGTLYYTVLKFEKD